ncbi:MAG: tetratricopeptide repeat protein, partial [Gloeomargarita sp. SKYG98]|nr:tetratricopeptide repeat protein [Gloeomargarita sp. SKYG98]
FNLGNTFLKMNQYSQAIAYYQKAIAIDKKFWPAINNIGLVQFEMGDREGARRSWQASVAIDPKAAEPILALAVLHYIQGQKQKAIQMAEQAFTLDRRYAKVPFLIENLWGPRLIAATKPLLAEPRLKRFMGE